MALKEKYNWNDFLKAHPDKKGLKRTSSEGKKAFEAAQKAFLREYLKTREATAKAVMARISKKKDLVVKAIQKVDGRGWQRKAKALNKKIGRKDAALAGFQSLLNRNKEASKQI